MENVFGNSYDQSQEEPGYHWNRIRLGRWLGGEMLGASVYVLPAGEKSFPYHLHHANEELLLVLEGEVQLRTPAGVETMRKGDAELFNRGPEGAHQVINNSAEPARFIMFSTLVSPEIAEYPDSGNIGVLAAAAGEPGLRRFLDGTAERDYFAEGRSEDDG
jgi:uncharacterized cupin superfamily protein